jgi:hypothetical protein
MRNNIAQFSARMMPKLLGITVCTTRSKLWSGFKKTLPLLEEILPKYFQLKH